MLPPLLLPLFCLCYSLSFLSDRSPRVYPCKIWLTAMVTCSDTACIVLLYVYYSIHKMVNSWLGVLSSSPSPYLPIINLSPSKFQDLRVCFDFPNLATKSNVAMVTGNSVTHFRADTFMCISIPFMSSCSGRH